MGNRALLATTILLLSLFAASPRAPGADLPASTTRTDTLPPTTPDIPLRPATGLLRPDRLQHMSLSFTIGLGAGLATRRPAAATATALGLGLAKEIRDRRHGGFDPVDLVADAVGAALAALATRAISR